MKKWLVLLVLPLVFSCDQEEECSDAFVLDYQRMGENFESLYKPNAGSFEVKNFDDSLSNFLSSHKGVECKYNGEMINPTAEVEEFQKKIAAVFTPTAAGALASSSKLTESFFGPKVIYGDDDREQVMDSPGVYQDWAGSTLAQISPNEWDASFNFTSQTYGEAFSLCPGERFQDELSVSRCSGFLVGPDIVVTAGHCVQSQFECDEYRWVLDFKDDAQGTEESKVFRCQEVLSQALSSDDSQDYAVIKLDRPVTGRKFFRVRSSGIVPNDAALVMIGYPSGISAKVADGANVRDNSPKNYFVTNTDSFGGNSGSAVINRDSGIVEGILVRGDQDFEIVDSPNGGRCRVEKVCANNACEGEDVTKMTSVTGIPLIAQESQVKAGLFTDKNFPEIKEGLPLAFLGYSYGESTIGGLKFLDRCGIHFYPNDKPSQWEEFFVGECSQSSAIEKVIVGFSNQFYF